MSTLLQSFLESRYRLARVVGRFVKPDDIEDILQEAFITSYAASRSQEIRNPKAFMMTVARNLALDHAGRADSRLNCSIDDVDDEDMLSSEADLEWQLQARERFLEFCRAVSTLPVSCRRVFILKKIYGLTLDEISQQLGLSRSTVEKHVAKGLSVVIDHMRRAEASVSGKTTGSSRGTQR